jgi:hypothetical protein
MTMKWVLWISYDAMFLCEISSVSIKSILYYSAIYRFKVNLQKKQKRSERISILNYSGDIFIFRSLHKNSDVTLFWIRYWLVWTFLVTFCSSDYYKIYFIKTMTIHYKARLTFYCDVCLFYISRLTYHRIVHYWT